MPNGSGFDYVALAMLLVAVITAVNGYFRHPSVVPASIVDQLRRENADCRETAERLEKRVSMLENQCASLRDDVAWWEQHYRELERRVNMSARYQQKRDGEPPRDRDA